MDIPTASVVIAGFAVTSTVLFKAFKGNNTSDDVLTSIKEILVSTHDLNAKATTTLALMQQKINGSHEKLDLVSRGTILTNNILGEVEKKCDKIDNTTMGILNSFK